MYDGGKIITGLIIFVLLVTFPIWYNHLDAGEVPKPELPKDTKVCVEDAKVMRAEHMQLLNEWRDEVLRDGQRGYIEVGDKMFQKSLQNACMECHKTKKKFCDTCHVYTSVSPYCWDCHLAPVESE